MDLVVLDGPRGRFSPLKLAGLAAWGEIDGGVWQDAARTTAAVADTDPLGGWTDLSGRGKHLGQGTASAKPTYRTGIVGGFGVARCDESDELTIAEALLGTDAGAGGTLAAVIWLPSTSQRGMVLANGRSADTKGWGIGVGASGNSDTLGDVLGATMPGYGHKNSGVALGSGLKCVAATFGGNGTAPTFYPNQLSAVAGPSTSMNAANSASSVGSGGGERFFTGDVLAWLFSTQVLGADQVARLFRWWAAKYGVSVGA